jgi:hypothetical protein
MKNFKYTIEFAEIHALVNHFIQISESDKVLFIRKISRFVAVKILPYDLQQYKLSWQCKRGKEDCMKKRLMTFMVKDVLVCKESRQVKEDME